MVSGRFLRLIIVSLVSYLSLERLQILLLLLHHPLQI